MDFQRPVRLPLIFPVIFALLLSGCGFQPLYGQTGNAAVQHQLSQVYIGNIPDREGQYLRNALIDRFYGRGWPEEPEFRLEVAPVRQSITDLDIRKSSDATRAQLRLDTRISLRDNATGDIVLTRDLTAVTSYNILKSRFTTRVSEDSARRNALDRLASQIETQLALYFNRQ